MIGNLAELRAEREASEAATAAKLAKAKRATGRAFKIAFAVLALFFSYLIYSGGYYSGYIDGLAIASHASRK